jgi:hypothetical protein
MTRRPISGDLSPRAREVIAARDAILEILRGLGDEPKVAMTLTYVVASFVEHLAAVSGKPVEACVAMLTNEVLRSCGSVTVTPFRLH